MNIIIIIVTIIIAITMIAIISIYIYNNYIQFQFSPFKGIKKWNMNSTKLFNKTNYINNINLINYVYDLYNFSIKDTLEMSNIIKELEDDFLIEKPRLIFTSQFLSDSISSLSNLEEYTIIGIIGKIKNTNTGIVCFRGTKNFSDYISDFQSMSLTPLNNKKPYNNMEKINDTPYFVSLKPPSTPDIKLGFGWYNIFNIISGKKSNHNCVCTVECNNNTCKIIPYKNLSKIQNITNCSSYFSCGLSNNCDNCSTVTKGSNISSQIIDYVTQNSDIEDYIITGHSMGGILSVLTAMNIGSKKVRSIYTYASPKIGNQDFKLYFDKNFENKMFRIENTNDPVPKLPYGNEFKHVGNNNYVFTAFYNNKSTNDSYYHDLYEDYLKSFNKIKP